MDDKGRFVDRDVLANILRKVSPHTCVPWHIDLRIACYT